MNGITNFVIEGTLSADSSNIVQLVKAQYQAITSSIEMKDNSTGSVKVRIITDQTKEQNHVIEFKDIRTLAHS